MELIKVNNTNFGFIKDFKHDQKIRASFNSLTQAVFAFSLEKWYHDGFWGDYYIPYSLLHNDKVVSNVSINKIEFDIEGERKSGIQIGTVMTDEKYRNRGLNKYLMEKIMHEWKDRTDFVYLFANDSVLDFYPKFKFKVVEEYQHSKNVDTHRASSAWKKLNMDDPADVTFLIGRIKDSNPIAKISMRNNVSLIMFYCNWFKKNSIYYIEELDAIAIADFQSDTLYLNDIFSIGPVNIDNVIHSISDKSIQRVILGFTPLNDEGFEKHLLKGTDTLFMLKDKVEFLTNKHWMFPVLSHA
ncbi:GNAT family N-acetyltransferase [Flagellimonas meishanensis]|uniref:GNAT family N-acetyltransferase n=1 Tax=Flagellimonas meishanensis TaxID=2873264 RepID=UPI001CA70956|nr:GNAT family N-acetyltransferase [[Muricauda] meishanensis]